jgi:hypothetical protein
MESSKNRRRLKIYFTGLLLYCSVAFCSEARAEIVDQIAAIVDGEAVTLSDVRWLIQFRDQTIPEDPEQKEQLYSIVLKQVIDEKLIVAEARNTPGVEILQEEIEDRLDAYRQRFSSEDEFQRKLRFVGMTLQDLRELFRRQLVVGKFVQVRIEPFVIVLPREIENYYRETVLPMFQDNPVPLELMESQIHEVVTLRKTNEEMDRWVTRVRERTAVTVLLFRDAARLPNLLPGID